MRIIAGEFSSRRIETRKGSETRPTLEKVREAVFSSLGNSFDGGSFLDLYAGSGANGLEALSRGMNDAVFVDIARDAIQVIRRNIDSLGVKDRCQVLAMKDTRALSLLMEQGKQFTVIYIDPPYRKQHNHEILSYIAENHLLEPGGTAVIESLKEEQYKEDYPGLVYDHDRVYGISRITYYKETGQD